MNVQQIYNAQFAYFSRPDAVLAKVPVDGMSFGSSCRYRTPEGAGCAVGCFIPPHLYHEDLEGVNCLADRFMPVLEGIGVTGAQERTWLHVSQQLHDALNTLTPRDFLLGLNGLALAQYTHGDAVATTPVPPPEAWNPA